MRPRGKRGLYGAWQSFTVALGLLAGAGVVALISAVLSPEELHAWGWRIPFFLAIPMGGVALWLRVKMEETPGFLRQQQQQQRPQASADLSHTLKAITPASAA
ncbi:Proline porter II [Raoultella terrigena]|uniref:Proline porter II n=1 Tax=Raoultella terrigena TaxID=577 RepID=A0A4U9D4I7_RAOTE|nr:Proline porter II [Raoultella terrigena]